jgi:hypothetical protein
MNNLTVYKGDYNFNIPFSLVDYASTAKDITLYKPVLKVWVSKEPSILLFSGSTSIDTATSGTCHYTVVSTDLLTTGTFMAEVELQNTTSNIVQTWDQFQLTIKESP